MEWSINNSCYFGRRCIFDILGHSLITQFRSLITLVVVELGVINSYVDHKVSSINHCKLALDFVHPSVCVRSMHVCTY